MQAVNQAVVTQQSKINPNQRTESLALFNPDGTVYDGSDVTVPPYSVNNLATTVGKTTTSDEPTPNTFVPIIFNNGNSAAAPTVAFNGGTARPILLGGDAPTAAQITVAANGVVVFWFDGTSLHQLGVIA